MPFQRGQDRCEFHLALARAAPVRIVDLEMRNQAGREPTVDQRRYGSASVAGGAAIDHRTQMRMVDRAYQIGRLGDGIDQRGFPARERLDAIDDAGFACSRGRLREAVTQPRQCGRMGLSRRDLALLRRAVDQHRAAEFRAERGEAEHYLHRTAAHACVRIGQRQAVRLDQQPVQPGDDEAGSLDYPANFRSLCRGDFFR